MGDGRGLLGDRQEQRLLVHFLKGVAVDMTGGKGTGNGNDQREGRRSLPQAAHEISRACAVLPGEDDAGPTRIDQNRRD